jgi:D-alanyl-D-alanine dipeptidase
MPTDFDDFTPAAMLHYMGSSPEIRSNLRLLRFAMYKAGFCGLRTEWWHFTILGWQKYVPPDKAKAEQLLETHSEGEL